MALANKTVRSDGALSGMGGNRFDSAQFAEDVIDEVNTLRTGVDALDAVVASRVVAVTDPVAKGTDDVHAIYDDTDADFPGPFTDPDVPRNLRVTKAASWDGGTITVTGTDQFDQPVSEVFNDDVETTVGVKIFKTVTGAVKSIAAGVGGDGASIGTGDKLGLPYQLADEVGIGLAAGAVEAMTFDATYSAVTPTTVPDAATTYTLLVNVALADLA